MRHLGDVVAQVEYLLLRASEWRPVSRVIPARMSPKWCSLALHGEGMNVEVRGVAGHGHKNIVGPALGIDDFLEKESGSLLLGQTAVL